MAEIPAWWLFLSGTCFVVLIAMGVSLTIVAFTLRSTIRKHLDSKIDPMVDEIKQQFHTVGGKANEVVNTAQSTMHVINEKTVAILGNTEEASAEITRKIAAAGSIATGIILASRVIGALRATSAQTKKK